VKLFGLAVALWVTDAACIAAHFLRFADDGYGEADVEGFGRLAEVAGRLAFITLLLLLARGYAVQFSALPPLCSSARKRLEGACVSYSMLLVLVALYVVMSVWYLLERVPGDTTYVYDSTPGLTECGAQFAAGLWFVASLWRTRARDVRAAQRAWMLRFGAVNVIYFCALPLSVLVALLVLQDYDDERAVEITAQATTAVFFVDMLFSTMLPSRAEVIFGAWQPDLSVVKIIRPEIGSVDLLTPVLSGYSTPLPFGQGLAQAAASRDRAAAASSRAAAAAAAAAAAGGGYGALGSSAGPGGESGATAATGAQSPARRGASSRGAGGARASRKGKAARTAAAAAAAEPPASARGVELVAVAPASAAAAAAVAAPSSSGSREESSEAPAETLALLLHEGFLAPPAPGQAQARRQSGAV
jgi:hypothetical protein